MRLSGLRALHRLRCKGSGQGWEFQLYRFCFYSSAFSLHCVSCSLCPRQVSVNFIMSQNLLQQRLAQAEKPQSPGTKGSSMSASRTAVVLQLHLTPFHRSAESLCQLLSVTAPDSTIPHVHGAVIRALTVLWCPTHLPQLRGYPRQHQTSVFSLLPCTILRFTKKASKIFYSSTQESQNSAKQEKNAQLTCRKKTSLQDEEGVKH